MSRQRQATVAAEESHASGLSHGVRAYRAADEPRVLDLLARSLKRWAVCTDPVALWRWKHFANPFGPSCILVNETPEREIAGVVALMFWRLRQGGRVLTCERTTDLATHPAHRRRGVASSFWGPARQKLIDANVALVFHTPNRQSMGFTRRSSRPVFEMRPRFGVGHAARLPLALAQLWKRHTSEERLEPSGVFRRPPMPVAALLQRRAAMADLLAHDTARRGLLLQTARTCEYLHWRFAAHPTIRYYAACVEAGGRLDGCVIFRVDHYGAARRLVLQEVLLRSPADGAARALRQQLDAVVDCDLVQYYDSHGPWEHLLPGPTLPTWNAHNFTIGVYDSTLGHSPLERGSWSLTLGDLQEI